MIFNLISNVFFIHENSIKIRADCLRQIIGLDNTVYIFMFRKREEDGRERILSNKNGEPI